MDGFIAKKISRGHYVYRGYDIWCCGYYEPEHSIVWEAVDEYGGGFAKSFRLRDTKLLIDYELNESKR